MTRFVALLFSNAVLAGLFGLVAIGAVVRIYGADLPDHDELVNYQPPMLSRVYSGEGRVIAEFAREPRVFAPIEEIPPLVKNAFISAEDKNYYDHPGVDAIGIFKALGRFAIARAQGRDVRLAGASTITQQVMKNFLLERDRRIERKIKEMILAVRLDGALSKDHILELYLNEIFLGARSYGVAAAARNYFGKPLEALLPQEAAYLAALPKAPSELHPVRDRERARARRNYVLEEMAQNGHLTRAEADAAIAAPLATILDEEVEDPLAPGRQDHFTAEVRRQVVREMGEEALYEGGLTIRATIDAEMQAIAATALRAGLERFDRERVGTLRGPVAVIETVAEGAREGWAEALRETRLPRDIEGWHPAVVLESGAREAVVGIETAEGGETGTLSLAAEEWVRRASRDGESLGRPRRADEVWRPGDVVFVSRGEAGWRYRQIPEIQGAFMAMDPETGRVLAIQGGFSFEASRFNRATQAERQPGSAFKPFVYAAALDAGYAPSTIVMDAPVVVRLASGTWRPKNSSGGFYGPTPLSNGLIFSRNLMTIRIAQSVGMDRVAEYAERFGVYEDMPHHLSYALGAGETTLADMVAAYGMFANGGRQVRPTVIDRIQDRNGQTLFRHDPRLCQGCRVDDYSPGAEPLLFDTRRQIMNPITAQQLVSMLEGVVEYGTAARTVGGLGFPVAGKTGTTNESRDAWFIGFTPGLVAGCFIGYDTPRSMGRGAYGGTLCGPVFRQFMAEAMEGRVPGEFRAPVWAETVEVRIDRTTGERLPDDAEGPDVVTQVYRAGTEPKLYQTAGEIEGDQALFADAVELLPTEIGEDPELPFEMAPGGGSVGPGRQGGGGSADRRDRPEPPADVGLGTGGLY
jgi:penicillin-binding protein 1A